VKIILFLVAERVTLKGSGKETDVSDFTRFKIEKRFIRWLILNRLTNETPWTKIFFRELTRPL